jgi:16S rRNA (cytidine1402-2'-O)-methyltransferase
MMEVNKSVIYTVATPIGNPEDITLRAIKTIESADVVIGEERKECAKLLRSLNLRKDIIELNEHTKSEEVKELIMEMLQNPKIYAQVSDCGTPSFEDPGVELVKLAREYGIPVVPVPGVSSLMTLIMVAGIPMKQFFYYGFLSPKKEVRISEIKQLLPIQQKNNIVLLDTPYRLNSLVEDLAKVFSPKTEIVIGYKLTMPEEQIINFWLSEYQQVISKLPKGEFVLIIKKK